MPLPPHLLARLAKRGIITPEAAKDASKSDEEEVIAEDYDDSEQLHNFVHNKYGDRLVTDDQTAGYLGCPNKWNIYHDCSDFCTRRWRTGTDPDPLLEERRLRMLEKYPLPDNWKEVYDPGTGRFYYWNEDTNMVSWLPPDHPRSSPSEPASVLRHRIENEDNEADAESSEKEMMDDDDEEDNFEQKHREQRKEKRKERRRDRKDLDPMDPASYSDIPRGGWSAGLERDVKSGVDSTASGPLFQQRPYPSPGAVLRANAASARKE